MDGWSILSAILWRCRQRRDIRDDKARETLKCVCVCVLCAGWWYTMLCAPFVFDCCWFVCVLGCKLLWGRTTPASNMF